MLDATMLGAVLLLLAAAWQGDDEAPHAPDLGTAARQAVHSHVGLPVTSRTARSRAPAQPM